MSIHLVQECSQQIYSSWPTIKTSANVHKQGNGLPNYGTSIQRTQSHTKDYALLHAKIRMRLRDFLWSKTKHRRMHTVGTFVQWSEREMRPPATEGRSQVSGVGWGVLIRKRQEGRRERPPWAVAWFTGTHTCQNSGTHTCGCILLCVNYTSKNLIKKISSSQNPFVTTPLSKVSQAVFSSPAFL